MAVPLNEQEEEVEGEEEMEGQWVDVDDGFGPDGPLPPKDLRDLHSATELGNPLALQTALENLKESGLNDVGRDGDTALHLACLYGHLSCVQILLAAGARLDARDEDNALPLHDACAGGYTEIVETLLDTASRKYEISKLLEATDTDGDTPLHHAARGEHVDVVRRLLNSGASPTARNAQGKTPAELADPGTDVRRILEETATATHC